MLPGRDRHQGNLVPRGNLLGPFVEFRPTGSTPPRGSRTHSVALPYQSLTHGTGKPVARNAAGGVAVGTPTVTLQALGAWSLSHGPAGSLSELNWCCFEELDLGVGEAVAGKALRAITAAAPMVIVARQAPGRSLS
jgi:hypothetical protein